jgi:ureidoglycolate dehydrogenase (NAD+)
MVAVLDPSAFGEHFTLEVDRLRDAIKTLPPAAESDGVYLPGERGFDEMERRSRDGVPLVQGTRFRLRALASELKVVPPDGIA